MDVNNLAKLLIGNPQQAISRMLGNNEMSNNLSNMIVNKDCNGLENFARNMAKEKGVDVDKMYNEYANRLRAFRN